LSPPIRVRLAVVCAALVASIVLVLGGLVYLRLEADLRAAADDGLATRAEELVDQPIEGTTIDIGSSDVGDIFAQVFSPDGLVVAQTPGVDEPLFDPSELTAERTASAVERTVGIAGEPLLARLSVTRRADGTYLVLGVAFDDQREALDRLLGLLAIAIPIAAGLAALVGWLVAASALRPVDRMRRESEAISGSDPSRRLAIPGTRDELAALGVSLNRMLDRLEATLARERRFVDDASHELRTPLANLKVELELALRRARSPDELVAALESAAVEADRLSSLAQDLLVLARADGGRLPVRREPVELSRLIDDVAATYAARAAAQGVVLETVASGDGTARVDGVRLRQALGNLIENAIRHTPTGGTVSVRVTASAGSVSLTVIDSGEGFPAAFLGHAFEPFSRADSGRSRDQGGAGLGLAIVQAVAEGHGGTVAARNNIGGGATVELLIPA
jgi:two-component system OmpR family sensor kinase